MTYPGDTVSLGGRVSPSPRKAAQALPPKDLTSPLLGWKTWPLRLLILVAALCVAAALVKLLLPAISHSIADNLPSNWSRGASEQLIAKMDHVWTRPTGAAPDEFEQLRTRFGALTASPEGAPPYRLVFRQTTTPELQLMSLPSGDIIVTDRFLAATPDLDVRLALLCVELGHLQLRHALDAAIRSRLHRLAFAALVGSEEGSVNALASGLIGADYTPEQLLAADGYALSMLQTNGQPASLLVRALGFAPENTSPAQLQPSAGHHRQYLQERINAIRNAR